MSSRIPNLFLIGAMKSATSYVAALLAEHPAVFVSEPREPCHFVDGEPLRRFWPYMWERGYWKSEEQYLQLFAEAGDIPIVAEGSVVYSQAPLFAGVPERILALTPYARFIYVLRDPVCRTISHYWHRVHHWGEERQMLEAIRSDPEYTVTSNYAFQLRTYLQHVNLDRFFIITYESLVNNPLSQITALYRWLGVDADFAPRGLNTPVNVTPDIILQRRRYTRLLMNNCVVAKAVVPLPRHLRRLTSGLVRRKLRPDRHPTTNVEAYLRPRQLEETKELSRILGRSFPEWTTLYG
jgi:hypothetical protein